MLRHLKTCGSRLLLLKNNRCVSASTFQSVTYISSYQKTINSGKVLVVSHDLNSKISISSHIELVRNFSKKKGSKKAIQEEEEESDDEEERESESFLDEVSDNVFTKNVPSMRLDTIIKAGLGMTKKKIEKSFYASKIRLNNERVLKKAQVVTVGDEIDFIRGFSPENEKFLLVDKMIVKSIGKVTGSNLIPVRMEVMKGLTVENYEDPWKPSNVTDLE